MPAKRCAHCGHGFVSSKERYRCCSEECQKARAQESNVRRIRAKFGTPDTKDCLVCGATFDTDRARKFCNSECAQVAKRRSKNAKRDKINAYVSGTPQRRINNSISGAVRKGLKGMKCGRKWETLVGYSISDLSAHLERLFVDGMSWENYGEWHVDHRIPKSWFYYETPEDWQFKVCWSLWNLQPMWGSDNIKKRNRFASI